MALLSYCICPKLPEEKLCDTLLVDEYKEDSVSWIPPPLKPGPAPNGLCCAYATVGLSGIFTFPSPEKLTKCITIRTKAEHKSQEGTIKRKGFLQGSCKPCPLGSG